MTYQEVMENSKIHISDWLSILFGNEMGNVILILSFMLTFVLTAFVFAISEAIKINSPSMKNKIETLPTWFFVIGFIVLSLFSIFLMLTTKISEASIFHENWEKTYVNPYLDTVKGESFMVQDVYKLELLVSEAESPIIVNADLSYEKGDKIVKMNGTFELLYDNVEKPTISYKVLSHDLGFEYKKNEKVQMKLTLPKNKSVRDYGVIKETKTQ